MFDHKIIRAFNDSKFNQDYENWIIFIQYIFYPRLGYCFSQKYQYLFLQKNIYVCVCVLDRQTLAKNQQHLKFDSSCSLKIHLICYIVSVLGILAII